MATRSKARKSATRNTDTPKLSVLPFPHEALFDAQNNMSLVKGLFESIREFVIHIESVEFAHDATAINAIAEKGERECDRAIEEIETVRKPWIAERQKAAKPAQEASHA